MVTIGLGAAVLGIHKYIKKISLLGSIHKTGETHTKRETSIWEM